MGSSCKRPPSIYSSLMVILTVIGYFGVSDADVVLRETRSENGLVLNKLQPSSEGREEREEGRQRQQQQDHPFRRFSINNDKSILGRNSKDAENESLTLDESMWDQIVIRALANPTEWVQLRQALDKVDADLRALTALENSKRNQSKSVPKWKFTYHRVMSPPINPNQTKRGSLGGRGGGLSPGVFMKKTKAFAAVSLATLPHHQQQQQQQQSEHFSSSPPSRRSSSNTIVKKENNLNIMSREDSLMAKGNSKLTGKSFVLSPFLLQDHRNSISKNNNQNHLSHNGKRVEVEEEEEEEEEEGGDDEEEEKNWNKMTRTRKQKWLPGSAISSKNSSTGSSSGGTMNNNQSEKQSNINSRSSFKSSTLNINGSPSWSAASPFVGGGGGGGGSGRKGTSRSRTQLEEEIAKMSSSRTHPGSSSSFHWRPWIHHRNYNPKLPLQPQPSSTPSPHLLHPSTHTVHPSPPAQHQHQQTHPHQDDHERESLWAEEMEKYHAQYHHHHHHGSHHTGAGNDPEVKQLKIQDHDEESDNAIPSLLTLDEDEGSSSSSKEVPLHHHHHHYSSRHHQRHNHPHLPSPPPTASSSTPPPPSPLVQDTPEDSASFSVASTNGDTMDDHFFSPAHRISSLEYRI